MEEKKSISEVRAEYPNYDYNSSVSTVTGNNDYGQNGTFGESEANQVNIKGIATKSKYNVTIIDPFHLDAKEEYDALKKELSRVSRKSEPVDLENGQASSEEFNLDEFLHGISSEQEANGTKRKHLGVLWKNLHVEVN